MSTDSFTQRYAQLNPQQQQAVDTIEGPLLVIAGPGSGKTELLSLRVANILRTQDVAAHNILCLTYTEAGASNMRQRLSGLIGAPAYQVAINTFHGFCTEIINRHSQYFYQGATFQAADDLAKVEILQSIFANLDRHDPLSSQHQQTFTYLKDAAQAISDLKKAGLTPDDFQYILQKAQLQLQQVNQHIVNVFADRISKNAIPQVAKLLELLQALSATDTEQQQASLGQTNSILQHLIQSLDQALTEANASGKTASLSQWKKQYLQKDDQGQYQLKDLLKLPVLQSLAAIYANYRQAMYQHKFYDYDDMVLDVLEALEQQPQLRYVIQEQYQYVLVDEFQDTNDAQLKLLGYITDAQVHEGRPNIMAVGDDDQAIYKFQGANLANIMQFRQRYRQPTLIVLDKNYRSSQNILNLSRQIITQGQERLESLDPDINKQLVADGQHKDLTVMPQLTQYQTPEQEYIEVAKSIQQTLNNIGTNQADQIAVICARRRDLEAFAKYLDAQGLPYRYDRQRNVLQEPHIHQLIHLARFVQQLANHQQAEADEYLPEILSYPFWGLERQTLWQLSVLASQASRPTERLWLWQMEASDNPQLQAIAHWFKQLRLMAATESVEVMLEHLIGAHTPLLPADEDGSDDPDWITDSSLKSATSGFESGFISPFKSFYFGNAADTVHHGRYLNFLSSLQTFIKALRNYRPGQTLTLRDMLTFVDLHRHNELMITDKSVYATGKQAIQLMTAHGAKGLEFDHVFLLSCVQPVWVSRGWTNKISFTSNLPLAAEGDKTDDKLRLFFVALTRARQHLYLSSYQSDGDKQVDQLAFLTDTMLPQLVEGAEVPLADPASVLAESWKTYHHPPLAKADQAVLWPLVENYQLSLTHLNDFLDVNRGGPQAFLEQHLLRFPEPKSEAQAYGTAVHRSLQDLFAKFRHDLVLPSQEFVLESFAKALQAERLSQSLEQKLLLRGQEELAQYYQSKSSHFHPQDIVEYNFSQQQVMVGQACLTGKIDRIVQLASPGQVSVHDIKTGKPSSGWQGSTDYQKLKLDKYRRQLLFYKLLVEHSRDFGHKMQVATGILEFVEPDQRGQFVELPLELLSLSTEIDQLQQLIQVVYQHITSLSFPDVTSYVQPASPNKGVQNFIDDLLAGNI